MAFSSSATFTSSSLSLFIAVALLYGTVTSFERTVPFAAVRKERIFWQAIRKRTLPFIRSRLSVYNAVRAAILCGNGLIILRMRKKSMPLFNDPLQNTSDSPRVLLRRGRRFLMIRGKTRVSKQRRGNRNSVSAALRVIFFLRQRSRRRCGVIYHSAAALSFLRQRSRRKYGFIRFFTVLSATVCFSGIPMRSVRRFYPNSPRRRIRSRGRPSSFQNSLRRLRGERPTL